MIETIAVIIIVAAAGVFAVRSICRTISGKDSKCSCGCDKCPSCMPEEITKSCADTQHNLGGKKVK
jgi:hypothetical protein